MAVDFLLLGPVEATTAGGPVNLGVRKQRLVAAVLALRVGRAVTTERLIDLLWPEDPPETARGRVHTYVSGLRAALERHGAGGEGVRIDSTGSGYLLRASPRCVDAHRFRALRDEAQRAGGDAARISLLDRALALWRGPALAGTASADVRSRLCQDLDDARLDAVEDRADALLRTGRHRALIGDLTVLAAEHPNRPRLTGQLMVALHRDGRTADALTTYQRAVHRLRDELGLDPAPELRELQVAILRDDATLRPGAAATTLVPASPEEAPAGTVASGDEVPDLPVPRQLPADVAHFTGRAAELQSLLAGPGDDPTGTVTVRAVEGMAGVGKTALAVHAAHRLAEHYPDGQIFVDLHGFTEGMAPLDPATAAESLLRSLGVPGERIPASLDDRAGMLRTRLAGRRVLIVLDNAASGSQVAPLLPGVPGCLVLVTSRRHLTDLGLAEPVSLDVLPRSEAVALFTTAAGRPVGTDRAVEEVVELCGRLPLAVQIVAARLRHRPGWTPDHLAGLLRGEHGPLAELRAGQRDVTTMLTVSYRQLAGDQRSLFRRLGLHPGPDIAPAAAAALLDGTVGTARRLLDDLVDAHLLAEPSPGRYQFHDLVRHYAARVAAGSDTGSDIGSDADGHAALTRLLDHYARTTTVAMDLAYPFDADQRPHPAWPGSITVELRTRAAGEAWLDAELDNLVAVAALAADRHWPDHAVHLSASLHRHLRTRARHRDALALHRHALAAARGAGDQRGEFVALCGLSDVHLVRGRYRRAAGGLGRALEIARQVGDRTGELDALRGLGRVHHALGGYDRAVDCFGQALRIARETGNRHGELNALGCLGHVHALCGRHQQAVDCFGRASRIARETGNRHGELNALRGLAEVDRTAGRFDLAADRFARALRIARQVGDRAGELTALAGLGRVDRAAGRFDLAADRFARALRIAEQVGDRAGELDALVGLADSHRARRRHGQAIDGYRRVLRIAEEAGSRNGQFEAHHGLARALHAAGRHADALAAQHTALELATVLNQPEDQARAHDGLARTYCALRRHAPARSHWQRALRVLVVSGSGATGDPEVTVATIRARLAALDEPAADDRSRERVDGRAGP